MVESLEEMSPASVPFLSICWSEVKKASDTSIENDGKTVNFVNAGGFRYCRSEQEFSEGSHRFEIETDYNGAESKNVSFGVAYVSDLSCDSGIYYFTDSYIYCNAYPSFTNHFTSIHKTTPPVSKDMSTIAVNFSFDSNTISWEIDGEQFEELPFNTDGKPCYIVVGMFKGKATFVQGA